MPNDLFPTCPRCGHFAFPSSVLDGQIIHAATWDPWCADIEASGIDDALANAPER